MTESRMRPSAQQVLMVMTITFSQVPHPTAEGFFFFLLLGWLLMLLSLLMKIMLATGILLILDANIYFYKQGKLFFSSIWKQIQHSNNKVKIKAGTGISYSHRITELLLLEQSFKDHLVQTPLPLAQTHSTRPCCSEPHSTLSWAFPNIGCP